MNSPRNDSDGLDFERIPTDIQHLIIEKFYYEEYAVFNECSRKSEEICHSLPSNITFQYIVDTVFFREEGESARLIGNKYLDLYHFPPKLTIHCYSLRIHSVHNLRKIEEYRITTDGLYFHARNSEAAIVGQIILATKPKKLQCLPSTKAITSLDEVRKLHDLHLPSDFETDDETLLNLQCPRIHIFGTLKITLNGILKFFEQWCNKEREIEDIKLSAYDYTILAELKNRLPKGCVTGTGEPWSDDHTVFICRNEKHDDCLKIKQEWYRATLWKETEARCPKFKGK